MLDLLTKTFTKVFGTKSDKDLKLIYPYVGKINAEYAQLSNLSDDELRGKTIELQDVVNEHLKEIDEQLASLHQKIDENPDLDINEKETVFEQIDKLEEDRNEQLEEALMEILPKAFAVVKETARRLKENEKLVVTANDLDRMLAADKPNVTIEGDKAIWANKWMAAGSEVTWNMLHYDVQLIGGIVLHQGKIAEMATGEGKTLVATLPTYLNALAKRGVHIVTVNNYLARRDAEWMGPLMEFHGFKVDCIDNYEPHSDGRKAAYAADVTYGTNNEFGFDYLRDNMSRDTDDLVQPKHHFAMIDEVDSVLVDDARTPLIISGPVPKGDQHEFHELKPRVAKLIEQQRTLVKGYLNEAKKLIKEGNDEEGGLALFRAHRGLPKYKPLIKYLGETGIRQKLQKTENFYLQDNAKMMPEADKPLFFTIDEKNNLIDLTENGIDTITKDGEDRDFFVLPDISIDVDAIEKDTTLSDQEKLEKRDQLINEYSAKSQRIHTVNQLLKAYALFEKDDEYIIEDNKVKIVDEQTGRKMEGRRFSDGLHQALEAKENVKIEDATQTYATVTLQNYFRMYHKLAGMTGTAETEAKELWDIYKLDVVVIPTNRPIQRYDRQDKVFKTMREKYNAVVKEIQETVEAGRPVLVGTTSVEYSELLSRFLQRQGIEHQVLNAKQHAKEADVVANAGLPRTVTIATNMAGRGTDIKLTPESKRAGGLAIIGTERHESRRVDRQLRGRSGRQGDPGSSQFFVSLEDNLMRLFGSERMAKIMDRLGLEEGEVIQHSMITKSIERAQRKVEENNFAIRKRLLEYDDVMNSQREVIYKRRRNALYGERLELDIMNAFYNAAQNILANNEGNYESFELDCLKTFGFTPAFDKAEFTQQFNIEKFAERLYDDAFAKYQEKLKSIQETTFPVIKDVYENRGGTYRDIVVPFTDGNKMIQIVTNLETAHETNCRSLVDSMQQNITLAIIDQGWKEHLREMDELKEQVQNARHEQKDPLLIYKFESFELFKSFIGEINEEMVGFLAKATLAVNDSQEVQDAKKAPKTKQPKLKENKREVGSSIGGTNPNIPQAPKREVEVTKPIKKLELPKRNERVTVKYPDGSVKKDVKFKSVEQDVLDKKCVLI